MQNELLVSIIFSLNVRRTSYAYHHQYRYRCVKSLGLSITLIVSILFCVNSLGLLRTLNLLCVDTIDQFVRGVKSLVVSRYLAVQCVNQLDFSRSLAILWVNSLCVSNRSLCQDFSLYCVSISSVCQDLSLYCVSISSVCQIARCVKSSRYIVSQFAIY